MNKKVASISWFSILKLPTSKAENSTTAIETTLQIKLKTNTEQKGQSLLAKP